MTVSLLVLPPSVTVETTAVTPPIAIAALSTPAIIFVARGNAAIFAKIPPAAAVVAVAAVAAAAAVVVPIVARIAAVASSAST